MATPLIINERLTIPAAELEWTAVRATGPGGQNVNKVSTKVQLRFDLPATRALGPQAKARLGHLARGRLDAEGRIVVMSQLTRNRVRNLEDAREKLAALIRAALIEPKHRRPTKPTHGAERRRLQTKRRQSEKKSLRGKVDD